jgi:dihydrofolate reductase
MENKNQRITIISAMSENRIIGMKNKLPWVMPADWNNFYKITRGKSFIMGRNSYLSKDRLLSSKKSIILSHHELYELEDNCIWAPDIYHALELLKDETEIFILGGGSIFKQTLSIASYLYLTVIHAQIEGDTYFPEIDPKCWRTIRNEYHDKDIDNPYDYTFLEYSKIDDFY